MVLSRKRMISAAIAAVILATGAGAVAWWSVSGSAPGYRVAKIERGAITAAVSATGTVSPVVSVQVGSQVSGQIKEIYVDFNSEVKKNQLIARIDPEPFQLRVNQAMADLEATRATVLIQRANAAALRAEVSRSKVTLADTERDFQRNKLLVEKNFVSAAVMDKAQAAYDGAQEQLKISQAQLGVAEAQVRNSEAVVKQRESQLAQAKVDLDHTAIRAPVDGIVISRNVDAGQTVAASLQAPTLFVLAQNLTDMQVETSIDEAEVGRVKPGQAATFTVDSFPGRTFSGTVGQVRKAALVVQNVVTYTAVISASNPNLELFPGMTANVRIVVDTRENVLKVPNAALRYRPAGAADARDAGAAPAESGKADGKGRGGAQAAEATRERLVKELNLNAEQQARVESITSETREKIQALTTEDQTERRRQAERLRAESRARIAEILDPQQRARYQQMSGGSSGLSTAGRVWVLDNTGRPRAVNVRTGLSDGTYTQLVGGDLQEGAQVIVGTQSGAKAPQTTGGPRFGF
jgi:HlyD family secretion protein